MKVDILKNKKTGKLSYYYDNNIYPSEKTHKFIKTVDDTKVRKEMKKLDNKFKKYF
jgi:sorbitol-specific phosphotransferase system component IIBC